MLLCVVRVVLSPFSATVYLMVYPVRVRIRAVQLRLELGSETRARRALASELRGVGVPPARAITRWATVFDTTGTVQARPHTRRPHQLTPSTLRAVRRAIQPPAKRATAQRPLGEPVATVHRALRDELGLFPYKNQLVRRLYKGDKARRLRFCHWLLSKWRLPSFRKGLLMSDEAHFHLNGSVVKQNCSIWGTEPPSEVALERPTPHM